MTERDTPSDKVVVIIDDDPLVLEAISGLLRGWGYRVVAAVTDDLALAQLDELGLRPDLIICDYRLSHGKIGVQAIERLRKVYGIPAFLITADARAQVLNGARDDQYLVLNKPVDPMRLRATISRALNVEDTSRDDG
jgi:CheY-like chemotaxis protein